jgi:hypothetical protein
MIRPIMLLTRDMMARVYGARVSEIKFRTAIELQTQRRHEAFSVSANIQLSY